MNIIVKSEVENALVKRKNIIVDLEYDGKATISKAELQKLVAGQFKASIDNVEISKILSEFGTSKGRAWIKIWKEKKVPIYSEAKKDKKAKPPEEKPAEAPKEEK